MQLQKGGVTLFSEHEIEKIEENWSRLTSKLVEKGKIGRLNNRNQSLC